MVVVVFDKGIGSARSHFGKIILRGLRGGHRYDITFQVRTARQVWAGWIFCVSEDFMNRLHDGVS